MRREPSHLFAQGLRGSGFIHFVAMACVLAVIAYVRLAPFSLKVFGTLAEERVDAAMVRERADPHGRRAADPQTREDRIYEMANALIDAKTFTADDGRLYPLLPNHDAYYWLRAARQVLATGTPCDRVIAGQCRDELSLAPVGSEVSYGHSLHVRALAGMHRLAAWWRPGIPLSATAMLLPLVVALAGCLPAYFIGVAAGGVPGGVVAALLIGLNPFYLARSSYGDNDVWNVVLPLYAAWFVVIGLHAASRITAALMAVLAAVVAGIHAAIWSGWPFSVVVIAAGLGFGSVLRLLHPGTRAPRPAPRTATLLAVFVVAVGAAVTIAAALNPFVTTPALPQLHSPAPPAPAAEAQYWADSFGGVAELRSVTHEEMSEVVERQWLVLVLLGLYCAFLPNGAMSRRDYVILGALAVLGVVLGRAEPLDFRLIVAASVAPILARVHARRRADVPGFDARVSVACIVAMWLLGALHEMRSGNRFILLLVAPYGVVCASLVGRVSAELRRAWPASRLAAAGVVLMGLVLVVPTQLAGSAALRRELMSLDAGWWKTFSRLGDEAPETVVATAWEYGHLAKYAAHRRVLVDGATIGTHVNHWLYRALASSREVESVGLLRMLSCGSDATPRPEGTRGALGIMSAAGLERSASYSLLVELANTPDREAAAALLAQRRIPAAMAHRILDATHCTPPPVVLVVSDNMLRKPSLWRTGGWDYPRAVLAARAATGDVAEVRSALVDEAGFSVQQADRFIRRARAGEHPSALATPELTPYAAGWNTCIPQGAQYQCDVRMLSLPPHWGVVRFNFDPAHMGDGTLRAPSDDRRSERRGKVAAVFVAGPTQLHEYRNPVAEFAETAVLIDPATNRVFVGPREIVAAALTQMLLLDGRYLRHFEKVHEEHSIFNGRITTWRVRWSPTGSEHARPPGEAALPPDRRDVARLGAAGVHR